MDPIADYALRKLLSSREDIFGEKASFLHFISEPTFNGVYGHKSNWLFGRIAYKNGDSGDRLSPPLALKLGLRNCEDVSVIVHAEFTNEMFFFTQVLPIFSSLRDARHLFAAYFTGELSASSSAVDCAIVFENLQAAGFQRSGRISFLDYDHLALMARKLGEFHAYSYEARRTSPQWFTALACAFGESVFLLYTNWGLIPELGLRGIESLRKIAAYSSKVPELRKSVKSADNFLWKIYREDSNTDVAVLCHGDFLPINVLFKYENGKPADLKLVDLSNCKLASPVVDLAQMLYVNADQQMRDEHWDDLIDEYYSALTQTFPNNKVPSKERIVEEFKGRALLAYFFASFFLGQLIIADQNMPTIQKLLPAGYENTPYTEIPKEERIRIQTSQCYGGEQFTEALTDILKDMIDRGFL